MGFRFRAGVVSRRPRIAHRRRFLLRRAWRDQHAMNQTVFITGTSSGIGRSTAQLFQDRGWNVAATMRNP